MTNHASGPILTLFLLMSIGFAMKKAGHMNKSHETFITKFLQLYAIPGLMMHNVTTQFTPEFLEESAPLIILCFLSIILAILISSLLARLCRISPGNRGIFDVMFAFSNTIFIGVPVITGIFGEKGLPYLMIYYLANTSLLWSLGVGLVASSSGSKNTFWQSLKKVLNPPMIAFIIGLFVIYSKAILPEPLTDVFRYLSNIVTPLSTIYMGSLMADLSFGQLPGLKPTLLVLFGRFLATPAITMGLLTLLGTKGLAFQVLTITSALPVMTNASVIAGFYGKDQRFAAFMTTLTTLLSIFILPLYFLFF